MNYEFQSHFSGRIKAMLEYRSALGRSVEGDSWNLANFDRFCLRQFPDESSLTKDLAFAWCNDSRGSHRAHTIRGFSKYLISIGEDAFLMPPTFFPTRKADLPYILSETELQNFFAATDRHPSAYNSPLLEYTIPVVFRLQFACGLRPQEVRLLKRTDFNFTNDTIYISEAKHCKDRRLAVNSGVMEMCKKYDRIVEAVIPNRIYFFQSPNGGAFKTGWLIARFHKCWELSGNGHTRGPCVPYDLRHNYATRTLMRWIEEGKDLNVWIPYLTAYMGHATFSSTFYYVHLLPERLSQMDFTCVKGVIPEVGYEEETE